MLVKKFKPEMFYKPGIKNIEANFLSHYLILDRSQQIKVDTMISDQLEHLIYESMLNYPIADVIMHQANETSQLSLLF
jgi:hypothetical protein